MPIDMTQFYQVFFEESEEHLESMEQLLLKLNPAQPDKEMVDALFRAAHSIKGGSATFGFTDMSEVTHVLETLLDQVRTGEKNLSTELIDLLLESADVLREQLGHHVNGTQADAQVSHALCNRLTQFLEANLESSTPDQAHPGSQNAEIVEAARPENTMAQPTETSVVNDDDGFGFFDDLPSEIANNVVAVPSTSASVSSGSSSEKSVRAAAGGENNSIRVSVEKVDQLINLVGELVITQAMLAQTSAAVDPVIFANLHNSIGQLERNTRDLQESVMSIRMLPISFVFNRYPRLVRTLAAKLGKQVELKLVGEHTELDKSLIEMIADPLTHLVRNSLDHGLETPDERIAAGKQAKGTITLAASHQGGHIVIDVIDDGAGLNTTRILAKAQARGLSLPEHLEDRDIWGLIFEPGFSTSETVTDVSGRGVGMDVVRRNITEMGGTVEIDSQAGRGTRITIRLPLTLAILDGMTVSLADDIYVIPLNLITETLQPRADDLKTVTAQGRLVQVRGEYLPMIALHEVFNLSPRVTDPTKGVLVLIEDKGRRSALFVDSLEGQQQVVIKSLESNYRRVPGISGATIMGDGKVALILDVATLMKMGQEPSSRLGRTLQ